MAKEMCDGSHAKSAFDILARLAAGLAAKRQIEEANPETTDVAIVQAVVRLQGEYDPAKKAVNECSDCSSIWAELIQLHK